MNGPRAAARRRARTRKKRKTRAPVRNVPSYVSTSSASGMPISPVPSDTSAFGPSEPQPYMRETIVNTAASSTVVGGAGKHHSSWSADAVLDPFVDPVPPVAAVKDANPFADPEGLAPASASAPAPALAGQRLSVASGVSVLSGDVQVSVG